MPFATSVHALSTLWLATLVLEILIVFLSGMKLRFVLADFGLQAEYSQYSAAV